MKHHKGTTAFSVIGAVIVLTVSAYVLFTGKVTVQLNTESLTLKASMTSSTTIDYDDIESIEYTTDLDLGSRSFGVGNFNIQSGKFRNEKYGYYLLYSYNSCNEYIIIKTKEEEIIVFNVENSDTLNQIYQEINNIIKLKY